MKWLVAFLLIAWNAEAHDWMPPETKWCCNNKDCLPHPKSAITRTVDGWVINKTGQTFKDGDRGIYPNLAPDVGEVWICHMPYEPLARCIFVIPEGS